MPKLILLVEPEFPIPHKSKNHSSFLPVGLLKIASYHRQKGDVVELIRGNEVSGFEPDVIMVTSLFTYWSKYVRESVEFYRKQYPNAKIEVGGIYASLLPKHCKKYTGCDKVRVGLYKNGAAEKCEPAYDLVDVDYQIIHASRGCFRHCNFCGVWKIENKITYKKSIKNEIKKNKVVFYDNNLLTNPHIESILKELEVLKVSGRVVHSESQSGLDGRILEKKPYLAEMLKKAHFLNPRIAWDGGIGYKKRIKAQIEILKTAGYSHKNIYCFMLFNHKSIGYKEMRKKLEECRKWGIQVIDCRYRPLDRTDDGYNPRIKSQIGKEYFIAENWTDAEVRGFRKAVRRQNIAIRLDLPGNKYIDGMEKKYISKNNNLLNSILCSVKRKSGVTTR